MTDYSDKIQAAKAELEAKLNALSTLNISELEKEKAQYQEKIRHIDEQIRAALQAAGIDVEAVSNERSRSKRLRKLVQGSEEWNKVATQIATVMKHYPQGLNGRQIAYKLGLTEANSVMRVQPVIKTTLQKTGQKASTKYFLKK